jgi:DNA-binding transcriptional ArsR family regulator
MSTDAHAMAALADPSRRAMVEILAAGPASVADLARRLPVSRPAVSQHLRVLKAARLVVDRQAGTRRIYQVDPEGVAGLRAYLDQFWKRSLRSFKAAVEASNEEAS